jgi:uncharacterized membrane protein YhaH (DUF805 family)
MVDSARAGRLEPRTDLVIGGDLTDWKPAGEVDGLFERKKPADGGLPDPSGHAAPRDSLADSGSYDFDKPPQQELKLPGATRLGYFLGVTVLPVILFIGLAKVAPQIEKAAGPEYGPWAVFVAFLIPVFVVVAITVKRFQNLGMSGWWWFGLAVPILSLWLGYRLFACPPGYVYTKKLGGLGKFLAVIYWISPVAMVALAIAFGEPLKKLQEDGTLDEWMNKIEKTIEEVVPKELPKTEKKDSGSQS